MQALQARLGKIIAALKQTYPDAHCELNYSQSAGTARRHHSLRAMQ